MNELIVPVSMETPTQPPPKDAAKHRTHRKGKGAQQRSNEAYRSKQNRKTQQELDASIEEFKNKLRFNVEKSFGSPIPPIVVKPPLQMQVNTWILKDLCDHTFDSLASAGKLHFADENDRILARRALAAVSAAQLEAKLYHSRKTSPFREKFERDQLYANQMALFSAEKLNFAPIAKFIDCVGRFEIGGQEFYPECPESMVTYSTRHFTFRSLNHAIKNGDVQNIDYLPTSIRPPAAPMNGQVIKTEHLGPSGRPLYAVISDTAAARAAGIISENNIILIPGTNIPLLTYAEAVVAAGHTPFLWSDELVRFGELQRQTYRRLRHCLMEVEVEHGKGQTCQLVSSADDADPTMRRAWCAREVTAEMLFLGSVFRFNENVGALAKEEVAAVSTYVRAARALSTFVDTMHGELV